MTSRPPIPAQTAVLDVAIVGAGFGGMCMAIKLLEEGNRNFLIVEKGSEVGGTWRDNSYPGAACDVQSHLYSFSFEGKADWSKRYAPWYEIQDYILKTKEKYGLAAFTQFNTEVTGAHFDHETGIWTVNTNTGATVQARHVVLASGPLHVPQIPRIKGMEKFKDKVFHSAQWDHGYDLTGKNVVSIGTGGSAIQYCPEIAPQVKQLYVFQRTPAWVIPRDERTYFGFEKALFEKFPVIRKLHRARLYWSNESRVWPAFRPQNARAVSQLVKLFIRFQVKDKTLAEKLTPDYTFGCKRVLISNKYYPMFNRKNVELVTDGIQEVRENSIVTRDGVERPCDCIILGTGFIVDPRIYMKDFPCTGLPGHELNKDWKDGAESYYGMTTTGYPNLFQLVGPNSALGHNSIIFMIEAQVHYIQECMRLMKEKGVDYMDVKASAQRRFNEDVQENIKGTVWATGCVSWYQQEDGKNFTIWPWSTWKYWLETRKVKEGDYIFTKCRKPALKTVSKAKAEA